MASRQQVHEGFWRDDEGSPVGQAVLDHVCSALGIDRERSSSDEASGNLLHVPHRTAQRLRIGPGWGGFPRLTVESDVAKGIQASPEVLGAIAAINGMASLSALILDETAGRLRASFSMALSPDGVGWQGPVLAAAGALQAEEVRRLIEGGFAQALGGEVDGPARPPSKPRETPDAADWWAHLNAISADPEMPEFGDELFWYVSRLQLRWDFVRLEEGLLRALIPCFGEPGRVVRTGREPRGLAFEPEECSVLSLATAQHPWLGAGLLIRIYPPFPVDGASAARLAHELNVWEAYEIPTFLGLGAWCADPDRSRVVHVTFLPAAFQARPDLLMALIVDEPERSAWFGGLLGDDVPAN